jgi:hypothetical protein
MRSWLSIICIFFSVTVYSQTVADPEFKFHEAANLYINKDFDKALASVKDGLRMDPGSQRLEELRKILEQEKKDQQKKDQENKEKEKQEKDKQNQQKKEQEQKEEQEKKDQEKKDKKDQEKKDEEQKKKDEEEKKKDPEKDKEQESKPEEKKDEKDKRLPNFDQQKIPKISEEKARMILEAMRNQEKQYLQQQKRKSTKPKDRTKPDW